MGLRVSCGERVAMERPVNLSGAEIRAILAGHKTQFRRPIRMQRRRQIEDVPGDAHTFSRCEADGTWIIWCGRQKLGSQQEYDAITQRTYPSGGGIPCPFGVPGDRLWVRETWCPGYQSKGSYLYRADPSCEMTIFPDGGHWRSSATMPRRASRLTLEITHIRVQRLQDITAGDVTAEGLSVLTKDGGHTWKYGIPDRDGWPGTDDDGWPWREWSTDPRVAFARGWNRLNAARAPWSSNPWVWAVTFEQKTA